MPNWCYQTITVRGPLEERQRLLAESRYSENSINEPEFKLSQLVPRDPRAIKMISSAGSEYATFSSEEDGFAGLEHTLLLWGSKWGDCDTEAEQECDQLIIHTKSAWSPIIPLIINVSKQFPSLALCIMYTEEFNHFAGCILIKDGKVLDEYEADVDEIFFNKGLAPSTIDEEHEMFSKAEEKLWDLVSGARERMISDLEKVLG
jgi:hypothetical protein